MIVKKLQCAFDAWHNRNVVPAQTGMRLSDSYFDDVDREVARVARIPGYPAPRSAMKRFYLYDIELLFDPSMPKGFGVFVDRDMKFLGAVMIE